MASRGKLASASEQMVNLLGVEVVVMVLEQGACCGGKGGGSEFYNSRVGMAKGAPCRRRRRRGDRLDNEGVLWAVAVGRWVAGGLKVVWRGAPDKACFGSKPPPLGPGSNWPGLGSRPSPVVRPHGQDTTGGRRPGWGGWLLRWRRTQGSMCGCWGWGYEIPERWEVAMVSMWWCGLLGRRGRGGW
jgi:hypothetical protein